MHISEPEEDNRKLPKFDNEILRISRLPPETMDFPPNSIQQKMIGDSMNFESKAQWGDLKGEVTHQYLKFINAHLFERIQQIEKLKRFKNELENEIDLLQSNNLTNLVWIPNPPINELNQKEAFEMIKFMNLQKEVAKEKIDYYKSRMENAKAELQEKEWQLDKITKNSQNIQNDSEYDKIVKEELEMLIKKYGIKKLTYAVDVITSKNKKNFNFEQAG